MKMPPSSPAYFYGDNSVSLETIRQLRLSRLVEPKMQAKLLDQSKKRKSKYSVAKSRFSGPKLFPGVSHKIKKPKVKRVKNSLKQKKTSNATATKKSVRQMMRDKFDFTRTLYAAPKKRVALNEETIKKRKFFKTSVESRM